MLVFVVFIIYLMYWNSNVLNWHKSKEKSEFLKMDGNTVLKT